MSCSTGSRACWHWAAASATSIFPAWQRCWTLNPKKGDATWYMILRNIHDSPNIRGLFPQKNLIWMGAWGRKRTLVISTYQMVHMWRVCVYVCVCVALPGFGRVAALFAAKWDSELPGTQRKDFALGHRATERTAYETKQPLCVYMCGS